MLRLLRSKLRNVGKRAYHFQKQTVEQLSKQNYYTARAYYHHELRRRDHLYQKPPLLVYQMGKVGSSPVTGSLGAAKIDRPIYHVHFLTPKLVDEYENKRRNDLSTPREHHLKHIWQYQHLNNELKRRLPGDRWKIVSWFEIRLPEIFQPFSPTLT